MKIFKYKLIGNSIADSQYIQDIEMPICPKIIKVDLQDEEIYMWAEVVPEAPKKAYRIYCIGTGHGEVPEDGDYIGTVDQSGFVWHFYSQRRS